MKKIIIALSLVLALSIGSAIVYAESNVDLEQLEFHKERMDYRRDELKEALEEGEITDQEYKTWTEHFDYMDEFHQENGFLNMGNGFGGCHRGGNNNRQGFGRGMMGNGWN